VEIPGTRPTPSEPLSASTVWGISISHGKRNPPSPLQVKICSIGQGHGSLTYLPRGILTQYLPPTIHYPSSATFYMFSHKRLSFTQRVQISRDKEWIVGSGYWVWMSEKAVDLSELALAVLRCRLLTSATVRYPCSTSTRHRVLASDDRWNGPSARDGIMGSG